MRIKHKKSHKKIRWTWRTLWTSTSFSSNYSTEISHPNITYSTITLQNQRSKINSNNTNKRSQNRTGIWEGGGSDSWRRNRTYTTGSNRSFPSHLFLFSLIQTEGSICFFSFSFCLFLFINFKNKNVDLGFVCVCLWKLAMDSCRGEEEESDDIKFFKKRSSDAAVLRPTTASERLWPPLFFSGGTIFREKGELLSLS